jgi:hypothetical protein
MIFHMLFRRGFTIIWQLRHYKYNMEKLFLTTNQEVAN